MAHAVEAVSRERGGYNRAIGHPELGRQYATINLVKQLRLELSGIPVVTVAKAIEDAGGKVIAAASVDDRSAGKADLGVPFFPLIRLTVPTYSPDALPPALAAIPAIKPGSRAKP